MQVVSQSYASARQHALSTSRPQPLPSSLCSPARRPAGVASCPSSSRSLRVSCSASGETSRRAVLALPAVLVASRALEATAVGINPEPLGDGFSRYYGKATAVSSYAGYGGNDNNEGQFRYYFDIPEKGWGEVKVNKTDKSTNGTDVRFAKSGKGGTKLYLTSFMGYPRLKEDRKSIISDLALSDYDLQDAVTAADEFVVSERVKNGQTYVDYVIDSPAAGVYYNICVTSDGARIYALFGQGPDKGDLAAFKRATDSFTTLNVNL